MKNLIVIIMLLMCINTFDNAGIFKTNGLKTPKLERKIVTNSDSYLYKFIDSLEIYESCGDSRIISNRCIGSYQLKISTLKYLGYEIDINKFKHDKSYFTKEEQKLALIKLIKVNEKLLNSYIYKYDNKVINNIRITKIGIIAAAHLAGATGVKRYFDYHYNSTDKFGTSIEDYLIKFSNC